VYLQNEYREVANNFSVEIDFYHADHSAMKEVSVKKVQCV